MAAEESFKRRKVGSQTQKPVWKDDDEQKSRVCFFSPLSRRLLVRSGSRDVFPPHLMVPFSRRRRRKRKTAMSHFSNDWRSQNLELTSSPELPATSPPSSKLPLIARPLNAFATKSFQFCLMRPSSQSSSSCSSSRDVDRLVREWGHKMVIPDFADAPLEHNTALTSRNHSHVVANRAKDGILRLEIAIVNSEPQLPSETTSFLVLYY